jgi:hypothetical protein
MKPSDMNQEPALPQATVEGYDLEVYGQNVRVDLFTAAQMRAYGRACAAPAPVAHHDDGMPTSADERALRRLLAARVAMPGTHMDDGEAQGQQHGITIDFMREPVADIGAKLRALNVARVECAAPAPVAQPPCEPVAARCRFPGVAWGPCDVAHARMVLKNPGEWPRYEVQLLCVCKEGGAA